MTRTEFDSICEALDALTNEKMGMTQRQIKTMVPGRYARNVLRREWKSIWEDFNKNGPYPTIADDFNYWNAPA